MIDTRATDGDMNLRRGVKCRALSSQCDHWRPPAPWRGFAPVRGDPNDAIDFTVEHKPPAIEQPRIMVGKPTAKAGAHRKACHPAADMQYTDGVVFRREWQTRETRRRV